MEKNRKLRHLTLKFSGINSGYYFSQIVFFGYFGTILRYFGYGETYIGTLQAVGAFSAIIMKLILGYVEDRFANPKKLVMVGYSLFAAMQVLMFRYSDNQYFMLAFAFIALGSVRAIMGVYEAWLLKLNEQFGCNIDYGRVRAIGSISYAIIGLVIGYLISIFGYEACLYVVIFSWVLIMISCLGISEPMKEHSEEDKVTIRGGMKTLFGNSAYVVLIFAMFLGMTTNSAVAGNFSIIMDSAGATSTETGIGFFTMAFTEFWVVYFFSNIARKIPVQKLFIFGLFMYTAKSLIMAVSPSPVYLIAAQAMQTVSFALVLPASVAILDGIISAKYKAVGMQIMMIMQSLAQVVFGSITGYVFEHYGYRAMLVVTSPWSALAAIIVIIYLASHKGAFSRKAEEPIPEEDILYVDDSSEAVPVIADDLMGLYPQEDVTGEELIGEGVNLETFQFAGDFGEFVPDETESATELEPPVIEKEYEDPYVAAAVRKGMPEAIYVGGFKYVPVGPMDDE